MTLVHVPGFSSIFLPCTLQSWRCSSHCGHHWAKAGGGRDRAEDPCNLTHRMSENVTQSQELSSRSAGATLIMYIEIIAKRSGLLLGICVSVPFQEFEMS